VLAAKENRFLRENASLDAAYPPAPERRLQAKWF
jgi:hypothetical protein